MSREVEHICLPKILILENLDLEFLRIDRKGDLSNDMANIAGLIIEPLLANLRILQNRGDFSEGELFILFLFLRLGSRSSARRSLQTHKSFNTFGMQNRRDGQHCANLLLTLREFVGEGV